MISIPIRLESIQNAVDQAKIAVNCIMGNQIEYEPIPWFWSDQFNLKLQIVGLMSKGKCNIKTIGSKNENQFSNLIFENNKLISVESVNRPSHHLLFRNFFKSWKFIKPEMITANIDLKTFLQKLS